MPASSAVRKGFISDFSGSYKEIERKSNLDPSGKHCRSSLLAELISSAAKLSKGWGIVFAMVQSMISEEKLSDFRNLVLTGWIEKSRLLMRKKGGA